MNDQADIDIINEKLYNLELPNQPIERLMFYFSILHNIIDYSFPSNFLNYKNTYFKTYHDVKEFLALANSLNPEFLHTNNALIFYDNPIYYKNDKNIHNYEFKVIDPQEANSPEFKQNYKNSFNIDNINWALKEFNVAITKNIEFPHSEDSDTSGEGYYYEEGIEENYQNIENPSNNSNENKNIQYDDIRKEYNKEIISNINKTKSFLYQNQAITDAINDGNDNNEEEEKMDDINYNTETIEKVNIINKLVCSKKLMDYIYYQPFKKSMHNLKSILTVEDEVRVKSVSIPKNIFFYLLIFIILLIIACAAVLIYSTTTLDINQKFIEYGTGNYTENTSEPIDFNNDSIIVPCHKCFRKVLNGCHMGMVSGIFSIICVIFIFAMYLCVASGNANKCSNKCKKKCHCKSRKSNTINFIHLLVFILLLLIAMVFCITAEALIIIGLSQETYFFIHQQSVIQLVTNSIILVSYFLFIIFYFKQ